MASWRAHRPRRRERRRACRARSLEQWHARPPHCSQCIDGGSPPPPSVVTQDRRQRGRDCRRLGGPRMLITRPAANAGGVRQGRGRPVEGRGCDSRRRHPFVAQLGEHAQRRAPRVSPSRSSSSAAPACPRRVERPRAWWPRLPGRALHQDRALARPAPARPAGVERRERVRRPSPPRASASASSSCSSRVCARQRGVRSADIGGAGKVESLRGRSGHPRTGAPRRGGPAPVCHAASASSGTLASGSANRCGRMRGRGAARGRAHHATTRAPSQTPGPALGSPCRGARRARATRAPDGRVAGGRMAQTDDRGSTGSVGRRESPRARQGLQRGSASDGGRGRGKPP